MPNWTATAKVSQPSANLKVETLDWGGDSKLAWVGDDAYIAQTDINLNSGAWAELRIRHQDADTEGDQYGSVKLAAYIGEDTGPIPSRTCRLVAF